MISAGHPPPQLSKSRLSPPSAPPPLAGGCSLNRPKVDMVFGTGNVGSMESLSGGMVRAAEEQAQTTKKPRFTAALSPSTVDPSLSTKERSLPTAKKLASTVAKPSPHSRNRD